MCLLLFFCNCDLSLTLLHSAVQCSVPYIMKTKWLTMHIVKINAVGKFVLIGMLKMSDISQGSVSENIC